VGWWDEGGREGGGEGGSGDGRWNETAMWVLEGDE